MGEVKTVPNQRIISINKQPTDKQHYYTANNLSAIDEAAKSLQSKGGFKLYFYLAKNQNKYIFALSSSDFEAWSGLGKKAYTSAFNELVEKKYLIQDEKQKNKYNFYDQSQEKQKEQNIDNTITQHNNDDDYTNFVF